MPALLRDALCFGLEFPDAPLEAAASATVRAFDGALRPLAIEADVGMLDLTLHAVVDDSTTRTALVTSPEMPAEVHISPVGPVERQDERPLDAPGLEAWFASLLSERPAPAGHRATLMRAEVLASAVRWPFDEPLALEPVASRPAPRLRVDGAGYVAGPLPAQYAWRKPPIGLAWSKPGNPVRLEVSVHWSPWAEPPTLVDAAVTRLEARGARVTRRPT